MNPISNEMIAELEALLGGNKVLKGDAIGADFAHDELPGGKFCAPALVCEAASTEDVAAVLTVCNRETVPITVRGAVQEPWIIVGWPPPLPESAALISFVRARRSVCRLPMIYR